MILTLKRTELTDKYTAGKLYIDGAYFCDTLEDTNRDYNKNGIFDNNEKKIYGSTCIPYGTYDVILSYSPKFKRILPEILNVPQFTGVRVHRGNYTSNTEGCILCGEKVINGVLNNSSTYEIKLVEILKKVILNNDKIILNIL